MHTRAVMSTDNRDKKRVSFSHIEIEVDQSNFLANVAAQRKISECSAENSSQHHEDANPERRESAQSNSDQFIVPARFLETRRRSHAFSISALDDDCDDYGEEHNDQIIETDPDPAGNSTKNSLRSHSSNPPIYRHADLPVMSGSSVHIINTSRSILNAKSFRNELRAHRDVETFLECPLVCLDLEGDSVVSIMNQMLDRLSAALSEDVLTEAHAALYVSDKKFQFSHILQSVYQNEDGHYLYEPTWFCA